MSAIVDFKSHKLPDMKFYTHMSVICMSAETKYLEGCVQELSGIDACEIIVRACRNELSRRGLLEHE